jgi:hypothetical protein
MLVTTLLMAAAYIVILRALDMNEKEPLWSLGLVFVLGVGAAYGLQLVPSTTLELTVLPAALVEELARLCAIFLGMLVIVMVGAKTGRSELNGIVDGLVYGASGGLGLATGRVLFDELLHKPVVEGVAVIDDRWAGLGRVALLGVADAVFGALLGAGLAALLLEGKPLLRAVSPLLGFASAAAAHAGYLVLARGNPLAGSSAAARAWLAMLLPVAVVVGVGIVGLRRESRAIAEELASEDCVSPRDLELLRRPFARKMFYAKLVLKAQLGLYGTLGRLHDRQVQLALAKRRGAAAEANVLRAAVQEIRGKLVAAPAAERSAS